MAVSLLLLQLVATLSQHIYQDDTRLLELAQRQKLLSQQMVKLALLTDRKQTNLEKNLHQMAVLKHEWSQSHFNLRFGNQKLGIDPPNNHEINALILQIQPHHERISDAINELLMVAHVDELRAEVIDELSKHEEPFLFLTDDLISAYWLNRGEKIFILNWIRSFLLGLSFLTLLLLFFLFQKGHLPEKSMVSFQTPQKKEFFNELLAEEYLMKRATQAPKKSAVNEIEKNQGHHVHGNKHTSHVLKSHHAKVLIIYDENIPIDYLAWFLNRHSIDFRIVQSIHLAQIEVAADTYDMVLMDQTETIDQDEYHFQIPVVSLEATDVDEIHALIHEENVTGSDPQTFHFSQLYHKIGRHIPKDKLRV